MSGSSTFPITSVPLQCLYPFNDTGTSLIKNVGATVIYVDEESSVSSLSSFALNIGASIEWQPGKQLYAVCASGQTGLLDVISSGLRLFDPVAIGLANLAAQVPAIIQPTKQYQLNAVGSLLAVPPGYSTLELAISPVAIVGGLFSHSTCVVEWFYGPNVIDSFNTGPVDTFDILGPGTFPFDTPGIANAKMAVKGTYYRLSFYDQRAGTGANGGFFVITIGSFAKTNQVVDLRQFPLLGNISAAYLTENSGFPQQEMFTYVEAGFVGAARDIFLPPYSGFVDLNVSYTHTTAGTVTGFLFVYPTNPGTTIKLGDVLVIPLPITNAAQFRSARFKLPPQPCRISFTPGTGMGNYTLQISLTESAI